MTPRGRFFIITLLVLATGFSVLFATVLRGGFRAAILAPLLQAFYLVRFYVVRLPQQLVWVAALLFVGALLVRVAFRALGPPPKKASRQRSADAAVDELERLAVVIDRAEYRPFYRELMTNILAAITARMIARQERIPLAEARANLAAGKWGDDPVVQAFFRTDKKKLRRSRRTVRFEEQLRRTVSSLERYSQGG